MPTPLTWTQLYLYPLFTIVSLWGVLTLGVLWLNRQHRHTSRVVLAVLLVVLALAHEQMWEVRNDVTVWGYYRAFIASMLIWTWHELAFYSGVLTGPWRTVCPPDARGWRRLGYALATHLYHILAIGVDVLVLVLLHQGAANQVGLWAFVLFWLLQLSAKLNVLLGVRNLQTSFFPDHMRYLASFWTERGSNPLFWPILLCISLLAIVFWVQAATLAPSSAAIGKSLLAGLMTLGVAEHMILVLPVSGQQEAVVGQHGVVASDKTE